MASNTTAERDTQLLSIGQQCSESSCLLVDFLPFKCQHCSKSFCGEHFLVAAHHCPQYDESKHNRVAPSCPLCNTPVAIPPGEDPNIRMEASYQYRVQRHDGKIRQDQACKKQYCPQHRFPKDHNCSSTTSTAASSSKSRSIPSLTGFKLPTKTPTAQTSNASSARARPVATSSGASTSSNIPALSIPFSKADRTLSSPTFPPKSPSPSSSSPTAEFKPSPVERRTTSDSQIAKILNPLSFVPPPIFATA
ncbi:hypothetical protein JVT61DRAFT_1217 [Boletus reticuloceps]|uniref:AN1-type domain-containing protein n=1 Tax=Boletus reticuloceps TaxID=495285 RepID=A0A8I3ACC4_9AGAM|nr:hypothetical protein JVT61DRAFT_1217 [Boletus reticuloceps]